MDETFRALPLAELADAALSSARALGCSHADVRVERSREARRSWRDGALQSTSDENSLGISVRVVQNGAWGFAAAGTLTVDAAATLAERAVATARVAQ